MRLFVILLIISFLCGCSSQKETCDAYAKIDVNVVK